LALRLLRALPHLQAWRGLLFALGCGVGSGLAFRVTDHFSAHADFIAARAELGVCCCMRAAVAVG